MKNKELDHVDREILRMLQENARMSLKDIAEAVFFVIACGIGAH